jgi:hypothetical protein
LARFAFDLRPMAATTCWEDQMPRQL